MRHTKLVRMFQNLASLITGHKGWAVSRSVTRRVRSCAGTGSSNPSSVRAPG